MSIKPTLAKGGCPICGKPVEHEFRPFCSRGCRDRDLINWFDEGYKVPIQPDDDEDETSGD